MLTLTMFLTHRPVTIITEHAFIFQYLSSYGQDMMVFRLNNA